MDLRNSLFDFRFGCDSAPGRVGGPILREDGLIHNLAGTHRSICLALDFLHFHNYVGLLGGDIMLLAEILGQVVKLLSIARPQTFPIVEAHRAALFINAPAEPLVLALA